jgi:hypothetical protein
MKQVTKAGLPVHTPGKVIQDQKQGLGSRLLHDARQLVRAAGGKRTWKYGAVKLGTKSVVLVTDPTIPLPKLVELTQQCRAAGAKLVLSADPHAPIGRLGMAFHDLARRYQAPTLTATASKKKDPAHREAIKELLAGNSQAAFENYARRGRLHISESAQGAGEQVFSAWSRRGLGKPRKHLMIAPAQEVKRLNQLAQEKRRRAKLLSGFRLRITRKALFLGTPRMKGEFETFYEGDRVQLTSGSSYSSTQPGELATISQIDPVKKTVALKLDRKLRTVTVSYRRFVPFTLAYALTAKQASNLEVRNAYVLWSGELQNRDMTAFVASKATHQTHLFTSKQEAGESLTALSRLAGRPSEKDLAHTIQEKSENQEKQPTAEP